uniref:Guanine nucleotide-binding protein subunit gamma n=6 Tax=Testudinoidea TaxID=8486 RepID=A0A674KBW1_9SAUR
MSWGTRGSAGSGPPFAPSALCHVAAAWWPLDGALGSACSLGARGGAGAGLPPPPLSSVPAALRLSGLWARLGAELAASMSSNASLSSMQRLVEQLKLEAGVERIKVSQAAAELQQYCMQNACKDALLIGVPAGSNPFREPRSCALL